jgi:tetratricopeptide (TPR) repeat protein
MAPMTEKLRVCVCAVAALSTGILPVGCNRSPQAKEATYLKRGAVLLAKKDYGRAALEFRNAVKEMPNDAEAYYQLGLTYLASGNVGNGIAALRHATEINPKHTGAQLKLAELMTTSQNQQTLRDAVGRLESVLTASPDNIEATDTLAVAEWRLGKVDDARKRLEEALRRFPASLRSSIQLARLRLSQNDLHGAEEVLKKAEESAPKSPDAAVALGELYMLAGQPDHAEPVFRKAIALDGKTGVALMGLAAIQLAGKRMDEAEETLRQVSALPGKQYKPQHAVFLYRSGKRDEALKEFEVLAKADPEDRTARTRLVSVYFAMGKFAEAKSLLAGVLKTNPRDTDALLQESQMYVLWGKAAEAQGDLEKLLHFTPNSAQAHLALAEVHKLQGMTLSARQELSEALRLDKNLLAARVELAKSYVASDPQNALQIVDGAPKQQKQTLAIIVQRNWALMALHNTKEVRTSLDAALRVARVPELVLQDGVLRLMENDYDGARAAANEVLAKNPEEVRAARVIVDSYTAQKQLSKAGERLTQLVAARPNSAGLQYLLGQWEVGNGKAAEARKSFEAATAANPKLLQAEFALAELDIRENRIDSARQRLTAITATDPKNVAALLSLANLEESAGNHPVAAMRYRAVLEVDASNLFALNNLAYSLVVADPDEASKLAQRAVELAPDNATVQDTMGWVYCRKGNYSMALTCLKTAVAREPTPRREFHLAVCYLKSGNRELGQKLMQKALQQDSKLPTKELGW